MKYIVYYYYNINATICSGTLHFHRLTVSPLRSDAADVPKFQLPAVANLAHICSVSQIRSTVVSHGFGFFVIIVPIIIMLGVKSVAVYLLLLEADAANSVLEGVGF